MIAAAKQRRDAPIVTEVVDRGRTVRLRKRVVELRARDGAPLVVTERWPVDAPRGLAVLLVHGLRGSRSAFSLAGRSLDAFLVEAGCRTLSAELRGSGLSREAGSPPPRTVRDLVELDLPALVELARPDERLFLLGHSLGALLCCLAAGREPEAVAGVVALAPPAAPGSGQPLVRLAARALSALARTARGRAVVESRAASRLLVEGRLFLDRWPLPPRSRSAWPGSLEPEVREELEAASRAEPGSPALLVDLARHSAGLGLEGLDLAAELARVSCPVLALVGDRDEIVPPAAVLPLAAALGSSRCEVRVVGDDGLGHVGHADLVLGARAPELVWPAALAFMEQDLER